MVLLPERNSQGLFAIEIEIAEAKTAAAIIVQEPTIEQWNDRLSAGSYDIGRPGLLGQFDLLCRSARQGQGSQQESNYCSASKLHVSGAFSSKLKIFNPYHKLIGHKPWLFRPRVYWPVYG